MNRTIFSASHFTMAIRYPSRKYEEMSFELVDQVNCVT